MTGFSALYTGASGLYASQRALEAVSQNIANANTDGYSRQRVVLATTQTSSANSLFAGKQLNLAGVSVEAVQRIRNAFYEATRSAAGARQSAIDAEKQTLTNVQDLLQEPTDSGLQSTLNSFYSSWHDLSNNPTDSAAGSVVVQKGMAVASQLNDLAQGLSDIWTTTHDSLGSTLTEASQAAADLATLNGNLRAAVLAGSQPNDLLDQRDSLVRKLGALVGGEAYIGSDGAAQVAVGGVSIVSGTWSQAMVLSGAGDITNVGSAPPTISAGGVTVSLSSGSAAGALATLKTDMPGVLAQMNSVASTAITAVNAVHSSGYTSTGTTGLAFFSGTSAFNIAVVPTGLNQLAVSQTPGVSTDSRNAAAIGDLADDTTVSNVLDAALATTGSSGPTETWRNLATALGVQVESLGTAKNTQDAIVAAADNTVESDAGVNLDEEMTNMMLFQRSYAASAKVVTVVDSMMDTLINMVR